MDLKGAYKKWKKNCPEEAKGLYTRKPSKYLLRKIKGAEAIKKRREKNEDV